MEMTAELEVHGFVEENMFAEICSEMHVIPENYFGNDTTF